VRRSGLLRIGAKDETAHQERGEPLLPLAGQPEIADTRIPFVLEDGQVPDDLLRQVPWQLALLVEQLPDLLDGVMLRLRIRAILNIDLDQGVLWPTAFALTKLAAAEEAKIGALVKKAVS